jgi:hypothetical protein
MLSLIAGNISSTHFSTILGMLVAREHRFLCNLAICLSHDVLWAAKEFPYKIPSDVKSYF